ncbi:hypothetical protein RsoM2USA_393 [Ralstonia phage RsoM2USA]|nr:hypothetical protein RsoM2USA_393 [Ralstonia phage RsoM2USA]
MHVFIGVLAYLCVTSFVGSIATMILKGINAMPTWDWPILAIWMLSSLLVFLACVIAWISSQFSGFFDR